MKTIKFRLLATMVTLAAVITSVTPTNAQRRSTGSSSNTEQTEKSRNDRREVVKEKSSSRDNAYERKAAERTVKSQVDVKRQSAGRSSESESRNRISQNNAERSKQNERSTFDSNERERNAKAQPESKRNSSGDEWRGSASRGNESRPEASTERYKRGNDFENRTDRAERTSGVSNREKYRLNDNDDRYKPNDNYKGGKNYWSDDLRKNNHRNNEKYYGKHHNHWDNRWENYRWNHNSWRNYYSYYDRYSYRHHKHYYYHPYYGHVIKRFASEPAVFVYHHNRYYCYDGHFFRYRPGIGYFLVEIPFGIYFENIPGDYELVRINGYLYYRVGNLFFENTRYGFELVHYPERYFAYDDDYRNEGISIEITVN